MSIFTSLNTKTLPVPGDSPHTVTFRKLAPKQIARAAEARRRQYLDHVLRMTPDELEALSKVPEREVEEVRRRFPLDGFDAVTLVEEGVTEWTYPQPVHDRTVIEDIDETTLLWMAEEVMRLTRPALFDGLEAPDAEAAKQAAIEAREDRQKKADGAASVS